MDNLTIYDRSKEFEDEIKKYTREIIKTCARYRIPCFMTFAVKNDENDTEYINDRYLTGSAGIDLKKDYFKDILLLLQGCVTIKTPGDVADTMDNEEIDFISNNEHDDVVDNIINELLENTTTEDDFNLSEDF